MWGSPKPCSTHPRSLVLYEPSSGLDPIAQFEIEELMLDLKSRGLTIFLSSHQFSEVEATCDRLSVLNAGRVVARGSLESLLRVSDLRPDNTGGRPKPCQRIWSGWDALWKMQAVP